MRNLFSVAALCAQQDLSGRTVETLLQNFLRKERLQTGVLHPRLAALCASALKMGGEA